MFNEETCVRCGECLSKCSFLEMPEESSQEEIGIMIETRRSEEIINGCVGCGTCNSICPTDSNPFALTREIKLENNIKVGVSGLFLNSEVIPMNLFSIGAERQSEEEKKTLKKLSNPSKSSEMFYLGCAVPYFFPYLLKTDLFNPYPVVGGMKYCCGAYLFDQFGIDEAIIHGKRLLEGFNKLGVRKVITLCSGCEMMVGNVYPKFIEGFDIQVQGFMDHFLERHRNGDLKFKNKINKKITFQDPCPWRELDPSIYDSPRALIKALGAELAEMEHNRQDSLCCGFPPASNLKPPVSEKVAARRVSEAEAQDVDAIAVNCAGCLGIARKAAEKKIETYHVIELLQMAIGENPAHRHIEALKDIEQTMMTTIRETPQILNRKYIVKQGEFQCLNKLESVQQ